MGQGILLRLRVILEERRQNERYLEAQKTCKQAIAEVDRENRGQAAAAIGLVFCLTIFIGSLIVTAIMYAMGCAFE